MLVAVVMAPLQIWVRGRRWWYLFPPGSNPPGLTPAMMIGYMVNNVVPARAGEVARVYVVARRWSAADASAARLHPFWTTLATLVVERVLDGLVVVLILAVLVLVIPVPRIIEVGAVAILAIDLAGVASPDRPRRCARRCCRGSSRASPAAGPGCSDGRSPRSRRSCAASTGSAPRRTRSR